jgi:hypothetical protein
MKVVAYVPDLMDRSRISGAAGVAGTAVELEFVASPGALRVAASSADLVIVDLGRPGVIDVLADVAARTVGFGSHVDKDLLAAAHAAGCDQVLARSAFFGRLRSLLGDAGG